MDLDLIAAAEAISEPLKISAQTSDSSGIVQPLKHEKKRINTDLASQMAMYESSSEDGGSSSSDAGVEPGGDLESDDEEVHGVKAAKETDVRTKNEILPPASSSVPVQVVEDSIQRLGSISASVDNTVVIQSMKGLSAMDEDSVICFESRKVLGAISEVFGPIYEPLYIVRFPSKDSIPAEAVVGTDVFYAVQQSKHIDHRSISTKGSDASNMYDEEPAPEEVEYSDDEQEAEARRLLKANRHQHRAGAIPHGSHEAEQAPHSGGAGAPAAAGAAGRGGRGGHAGGRGRGSGGAHGGRRGRGRGGAGDGAAPGSAQPGGGYAFAQPPPHVGMPGPYPGMVHFGYGGPGPGVPPPHGAGPAFMPSFGPGSRPVLAGGAVQQPPPPGFGPPPGGMYYALPPGAGYPPPPGGGYPPPGAGYPPPPGWHPAPYPQHAAQHAAGAAAPGFGGWNPPPPGTFGA